MAVAAQGAAALAQRALARAGAGDTAQRANAVLPFNVGAASPRFALHRDCKTIGIAAIAAIRILLV
jgi:hypothetical protein